MYRHRWTAEVKYGHYREFYDAMAELTELCEKAGLADVKSWLLVAGRDNVVVHEQDYPSLDALEKDQAKFFADPDVMKTFRKASEHVVQGSSFSEILMEAQQIA